MVYRHLPAGNQFLEIEAEGRGVGNQLLFRFLEADENTGLVVLPHSPDEEFQTEYCLSGASQSQQKGYASGRQASQSNIVKTFYTGRNLRSFYGSGYFASLFHSAPFSTNIQQK